MSRMKEGCNKLLIALHYLWSKKGYVLRALFCWLAGVLAFLITDSPRYDIRFQIRGQQAYDHRIVLVNISKESWQKAIKKTNVQLSYISPLSAQSDVYYWSPELWSKVIQKVLKDDPSAIGIQFLFSNIYYNNISNKQLDSLTHRKVIWASRLNSNNREIYPKFVDPITQTTGTIQFPSGFDGIVRAAPSKHSIEKHMSFSIAKLLNEAPTDFMDENIHAINYSGPQGTYQHISLSHVLNGQLPRGYFHNKIVLIGQSGDVRHTLQTPVGQMNRSETVANTIDNIINGKTLLHVNPLSYVLFLSILLLLSIWITMTYPQALASVILFMLGTCVTAVSLWLFDSYYFWTPIFAPLLQLSITFVVFLSLKLSVKENLTWRLKQERTYLYEIKQLKDNFVSLISHDLKTPIAKIQGIIDRILTNSLDDKLKTDLLSLRRESSELNRYIQSIIRVLRVESRDIKLNKEPSDINQLIEAVHEQIKPLADLKQISIEAHLEPLFLIEIDSVLIQEVILNLVENAIKYTPEKGHIKIMSSEIDDHILVIVEDSGAGISKEEQSKIFEKFHRGKEHSFQTKGTGLGLYLVKYFIELHGGEVFLESELAKGTTVGFTLPLEATPTLKKGALNEVYS